MRKIVSALAGCGAVITWFSKETIKTWLFAQVLQFMNPDFGSLIEYGIPASFAALCLGLIVWDILRRRNPTTSNSEIGQRTGIDLDGSTLELSDSTIENQDTAIRAKDSKIGLENFKIK